MISTKNKFGAAINALVNGGLVYRSNWGENGAWLQLDDDGVIRGYACEGHLKIKDPVCVYAPTQEDILADNWVIWDKALSKDINTLYKRGDVYFTPVIQQGKPYAIKVVWKDDKIDIYRIMLEIAFNTEEEALNWGKRLSECGQRTLLLKPTHLSTPPD